jgi:hypothetical protein
LTLGLKDGKAALKQIGGEAQCPVAEKWTRSLGSALRIRGLSGQLSINWPKRAKSDTSTAPFGFVFPEWFEVRPAQTPGQDGALHFWKQIASDSSGSRKPELSVPLQPFLRAKSK